MNKEKFKTKREAITFQAALPANVRSQIYKGYRGVVVQWKVTEVEKVTKSSGCVFCDIGLKPDDGKNHYDNESGKFVTCVLVK